MIAIAGTSGARLRPMNPKDPEAPYFVKLMGSNLVPTNGFMQYSISPAALRATFIRTAGGGFTDAFSITEAVPTKG